MPRCCSTDPRMSRLFLPRLTSWYCWQVLALQLTLCDESGLAVQALALLAAVSAPTIAVIHAIISVEREGQQDRSAWRS